MKILHFHSRLSTGGVETMIVNLSNKMAKTEDVSVCLIYKPTINDIYINKLDSNIKTYTLGKKKNGFSLITPFKIFKFLKNNHFDVVQLHGFFYYYFLSILFLHKKIKFFYTVHNDAFLESTKWDQRIFKIKKNFFKRGWLHPITISDESQRSFNELYDGIKNTKIYNGIEKPQIKDIGDIRNTYKIPQNSKILLNPGRICKQKNQLALVKTVKKLLDEGEQITLLIAGNKSNDKIYEELEPYFNSQIIYLGEIDNIPSIMSQCNAMCLSSKWEGLPIVLLEALGVGCIPICTAVGGVKDVIQDRHNGLIIKDADETTTYRCLKDFLKLSDKEIIQLKDNCLKSFNKYEIQSTCNKYLKTYQA